MREGHGAAGKRTSEDHSDAARAAAAAGAGVVGVSAKQDEDTRIDWGNTGHVGTLATLELALGAVGVCSGRGCGGGCCADS